ncbi:RNA demethylase ALKBH9B-like [Typha angustifolia]|uniref:RNA demethylase ALKBH9B-like n=1 Tax=Typha angustifolia TaxID=59011 RepID=UPI003C2BE788
MANGNSEFSGQPKSPELREEDGRSPAAAPSNQLSREQREAIRLSLVKRKKDFKQMERVRGRWINVLEGLELHTGVFSAVEQQKIVDCVYDMQEEGRRGRLRERTYSEPHKWMRGKGRVTLQFGCCYNYAVDKRGNPPGIIRDEEVDPIPPLLKMMIKRMVAWHVLPPTCVPNSCIINIYDRDDCIPPHIDHHDFVRPFCTVSFLSECNILFGTELKVVGPGEFAGSASIPLPLGSVLILKGNGADVAKHCIPAVPSKRISITFRKMDDSKLPYGYMPDPELQNLRPLPYPSTVTPVKLVGRQASPVKQESIPPVQTQEINTHLLEQKQKGSLVQQETDIRSAQIQQNNIKLREQKLKQSPQIYADRRPSDSTFSSDDFPPLGSSSGSSSRSRSNGTSRHLRRN